MNVLTLQANQNKEHDHGTWTSNVYNTSGTRVNNTGGMSANAEGNFNAQPNGRSGDTYQPYANGNVSINSTYSGSINTGNGSSKNSYHINVAHTHDMQHKHKITSEGGDEARPDNYTYKVWKRVN